MAVVIPFGGDGPANAEIVERCGAGPRIAAEHASGEDIGSALEQVLKGEGPRVRSEGIAREMASMPSPHETGCRLSEMISGRG